jgi:hypothetical protein
MSEDVRGTLEMAAEEAFAGMRAYHRSEIDHKRDAITVLTTVLAGNGGLVAAGFGALGHADRIGWLPIAAVAVVVFAATAILATQIVNATNDKIESDGRRYQEFKAQSISAKRLLGLYAPITTEHGTLTLLEEPKPSLGKAKTQRILDTFLSLVVIFSLVGWLALIAAWMAADAFAGGAT